jgi:hypothetical protein
MVLESIMIYNKSSARDGHASEITTEQVGPSAEFSPVALGHFQVSSGFLVLF